ncbi:MAG: sigma-54 dependent transcriptional regulator [Desulfovibrio sp.]|jgi:two-component system nitrogen regulation response regulator NtrX|nr:sigma-54 dependent transcriptional regulator [Desulfovibrio sp.]
MPVEAAVQMKTSRRLLIVDDEEGIRLSLRGILEDEGYTVLEASCAEEGFVFLEKDYADLVFLDIWLPGMDGLAALEFLRASYPSLPVLMISGHGTIETAVAAIKKGAHDFIEKPLSLEKVIIAVERALEFQALKKENMELRERLDLQDSGGPIGASPVMLELREQIRRVAPLDTWVLITGENGTGKEIAARAVHASSRRSDKPMVALNCAAIPDELIESELFGHEKGAFTGADSLKIGKFEMAHQGTLFLDEIGDMSLKTQAKILRILQEKSFERVGGNKIIHTDVRVIAATNKDLEAAISTGTFREDLYYRLRVFPLHLPPLRERGDDIFLLADYFTATLAQDLALVPVSFAPDAKRALRSYAWPGNIRELRNFLERMIILHSGGEIAMSHLPGEFHAAQAKSAGQGRSPGASCSPDAQRCALTGEGSAGMAERTSAVPSFAASEQDSAFILPPESLSGNFKSARSAFEARFLAAKLQEYDGNISRLAEAIGLERSYLSRKLKLYNIQSV